MAVQWPLTAKTAFVTALKLLQTVLVNNKQYQDITINAIQKKKKKREKKKRGFTPCKAEQPLHGMELQEKRSMKRLKHTGNLFRGNLQLIGVC